MRHDQRNRPDALDLDLARQRLKSPHFPTFADAMENRQRRRENLAARLLLGSFLLSLLAALVGYQFAWTAAGFALVGFIVCCFVAGSRHDKRTRQ